MKSGIHFLDYTKSLTLNDLVSQYCNRNCLGCSAFFLATAGVSCCRLLCHVTRNVM